MSQDSCFISQHCWTRSTIVPPLPPVFPSTFFCGNYCGSFDDFELKLGYQCATGEVLCLFEWQVSI